MRNYVILFAALSLSLGLQAQDEDLTIPTEKTDRSVNAMFNRQDPSTALQTGGAFFISNPPLPIEMDVDKAYFRTEWEELIVRMIDGNTATVQGRYRLIDQKFEIKQDDGIYEIRNTVVRDAQLGDDYFIMLPFNNEMTIFETHYRDSTFAVLTRHYTEWQDPPVQKLYETKERKRTLKRKDKMYILTPYDVVETANKSEVLDLLFIFKGSRLFDYVRKQKIDVRDAAELGQLLRYMEENDLVHSFYTEG